MLVWRPGGTLATGVVTTWAEVASAIASSSAARLVDEARFDETTSEHVAGEPCRVHVVEELRTVHRFGLWRAVSTRANRVPQGGKMR